MKINTYYLKILIIKYIDIENILVYLRLINLILFIIFYYYYYIYIIYNGYI